MATKKVSTKRPSPKTKPPTSKAKPADGPKPTVKRALAPKAPPKSIAPRKTAVSIAIKPAAVRAAEALLAADVEANIGGSRPLADFLKEIEWYK